MKIQANALDRLINASYLFDMNEDEIWREIDFLPEANTENKYFVSNYGSIISLCRNKPIVLQPFLCGNPGSEYYYVSICGKDYRINRLVAQAFIPNTEDKPIVHHKDHNKLNNLYSNLCWATAKENTEAYLKHKEATKERK